jgi:hypothetical protein
MEENCKIYKRLMKRDIKAIEEISSLEQAKEIIKMLTSSVLCKVKMKRDSYAEDGTDFIFKEGLWYIAEQDQSGVTIWSDDMKTMMFLNYDEVDMFIDE